MNLREVKQRILSVKSTQKITSAMKLVSSAKLRRAQAAIESMRPYETKLNGMLETFFGSDVTLGGEYTALRKVDRVAVIAVASDSSLCGAFNANMSRLLRVVLDEYRAQGIDVRLYTVGRKMLDAARKMEIEPDEALMSQSSSPRYNEVSAVASALMDEFRKGMLDRVEILYTRFASASKHIPTRDCLLPVAVEDTSTEVIHSDFIVEPGKEELVNALLPKSIALKLFTALLDSVAAEHAARMMAMQIATDNADDLIAELTLEYNKGRQQAITNELLDIVAGSNKE